MRIAVAGFLHESNTFSPILADRAAFVAQGLAFGEDVRREWSAAHHEVGGFLTSGGELGYDAVPLVAAWATPSGPVVQEVFDEVVDAIIAGLKRERPDGLLLGLHGAMVTTRVLDADAEVIARIVQAVGRDFPLAVTFDLHGNLSPRLPELCDIAVAYRTNPHVDQRECGTRAARLLVRRIRGEINPRLAIARPPLIVNIMKQDSSREPFAGFLKRARALEDTPGVYAASFLPGFAYADVPQMGPSVIVVGDDPRPHAEALGEAIWQAREQFDAKLPEAAEAVRQAMAEPRTPVVLVETGDNVGGGSAGDSTFVLAELLRQGATGWVVMLYAPDEARQCIQAGLGAEVRLLVGGKVDRFHGDPVPLAGRVALLHDGTYTETQVRHGGKRLNHMGPTALVEVPGGSYLALTTLRHPPFSLGALTCLGIEPARQRILVVKAAIAYKAAYAPVAGCVIEADTPGRTAINPTRFEYRHVRRPIYPLD